MYVRLAFAVAAHLKSDILIVDEVLAVGDAEFQKKCLGKMGEVSKAEGRTILFVSHNMIAIKNLCSSAIHMSNGKVDQAGYTDQIINKYLLHNNKNVCFKQSFNGPDLAPGNEKVKLKRIELCPVLENQIDPITIKTAIHIEFEFWSFVSNAGMNLSMSLNTMMDECIFTAVSNIKSPSLGLLYGVCVIPPELLNDGFYYISMLVVADGAPVHCFDSILTFEVNESRETSVWHGKWPGALRPKLDFKLT